MDDTTMRKVYSFVRKEVKEYVCYCGRTGMDYSRIHFDHKHWTMVELKCVDGDCNHKRTVRMYYPDEVTDYIMD
jgi:hypothetical protein